MNFSIFCKKNGNTFQKQASSMAYPLLTAIFVFLLTWLILPGNSLFGSEGDWFSHGRGKIVAVQAHQEQRNNKHPYAPGLKQLFNPPKSKD